MSTDRRSTSLRTKKNPRTVYEVAMRSKQVFSITPQLFRDAEQWAFSSVG